MMIESRRIRRTMKDYKEVKELIYSSFPKDEIYPLWLLRLMGLRKGVNFLARYEDGNLIAITFEIFTDEAVFGLYLAVKEELRSKGYGERIFRETSEKAGDRPFFFNIEAVEESADNHEQRVRRREFYRRRGYYETGYEVMDGDDRYSIMADKMPIDIDLYVKTVSRLSFGLIKPEVIKACYDEENS